MKWRRNSGLSELRIIKWRNSGEPDLRIARIGPERTPASMHIGQSRFRETRAQRIGL